MQLFMQFSIEAKRLTLGRFAPTASGTFYPIAYGLFSALIALTDNVTVSIKLYSNDSELSILYLLTCQYPRNNKPIKLKLIESYRHTFLTKT